MGYSMACRDYELEVGVILWLTGVISYKLGVII